ncbi:hypothetical protein [Paenibacillus hexagrammi]|uniref:Uncharacterized protein n=1 Tax=Paenibacillus hexagrammi TaxID=2908839 RepID=A0ABY3SL18_9BACL|nr:hypothetical protein [Paenibacillus sp. YPD9-1]UJF34168.1 hypothetical protein L0M14_02750 [Paenibacillus sp. YPD9-1]
MKRAASASESDIQVWNRRILNAYWIVLLVSIFAELAALVIIITKYPEYIRYYIMHVMVVPNILLICILGLNEVLYRKWQLQHPLFSS